MIAARIDPALSIRILSSRELRYSVASTGEDRPEHVRAASGLAFTGGRLAVVQDDVAFIGMVAKTEVATLVLPRGAGGRRRFEVGIGNKHDKYDLESCVAIGDDLFAFGSGSTQVREKIVHIGYATRVLEGAPLYRQIREEIGGACNIEGVALVTAGSTAPREVTPLSAGFSGAMQLWPDTEREDDEGKELWLFHRGNTGPTDRGPMIIRFGRVPVLRWLLGNGPIPEPLGSQRVDLGSINNVRYGFTDAIGVGRRVFYIAAAEDTANAVDDGPILGSHLGVIDGLDVRATPLEVDGVPLKAEGLAFDPSNPRHAWVAIDPDDVDTPAMLYEVELVGPW